MQKTAALLFMLSAIAVPLCADDFTDMVQAIAVKAASLGTYDTSRVNDDFNIDNYYSPQTWDKRFAAEYGSIAEEQTFVGVCDDYTLYAYNDIKANQQKYNNAGVNGDQFFIASVGNNSDSIEIQKTTTLEDASVDQAGVYMTNYYNNVPVKKYDSKNIWAHKEWNDKRASNHAWIWIQRDDGVWFWVDPTWTDNLGWVVWGYIDNGEEILLKPDPKFCIKWRSEYLDGRADPPARIPAIEPTYVAESQEPSTEHPTSSSSSSTSSSRRKSLGYNWAISIGVSKALNGLMDGNSTSSFWDIINGISVSFENGNRNSLIGLLQLDYYNFDKQTLILNAGLGKQFGTICALYGGAGIGAGTTTESLSDLDLAWKAFAGVRVALGHIALRTDVSYVGESGFIVGAYTGWLF